MKAKVAKYQMNEGYCVGVWWTYDPDKCPHDWNLLFQPDEWRKVKCRTPKKNETIEVDIEITERKKSK
jgi:hypothetical protein